MSESSLPPPVPLPQEFCKFCGAQIPPRGLYCPRCGAMSGSAMQQGLPPAGVRQMQSYMQPVRKISFRLVIKTISAFIIMAFLAQLALSLVTLLYGADQVVPDILDFWEEGYTFILLVPFIVELFTISGSTLLVYYFFLIVAIVISCIWVLLTSYRVFMNELTMKAKSREHSALFETAGLLFATLFFSFVVALLANPSTEDLPVAESVSEMLFLLANASVYEELIVRVLLLGLPLVLVDMVRHRKQAHWYSYVLGGNIKIGYPETTLLVISSMIFGLGHLSGWGAWKILPAAVGGLALGYLFLKFGIAASIMLHFSTDYMTIPVDVFVSDAMTLVVGIGILVWLAAGFCFFTYYSTRVVEFLTRKRYFDPTPAVYPQPWGYPTFYPGAQAQGYPPQNAPVTWQQAGVEQQYPPGPQNRPVQSWFTDGYVCPSCGYTQARWVNGQFQCMRCGRLS